MAATTQTGDEEDPSKGQEGEQQPPAGNGEELAGTGAELLKALNDNLVKLVTALGTTAGFVTLVAGTGGAILWSRFWAAGLPADQALAEVPRNELVAAGALTLGLFIVLALIAVAGIYAIDSGGGATNKMRVGLAALVAAELIVVILVVGGSTAQKAIGLAFCLGLLAIAFALVVPLNVDAAKLWPLALVAAMLTAGLFVVLYQDDRPGTDWAPGVAVLVACALAAICFGVARSSGTSFWPYAIAVFFSVIIFGAVFSTWRLAENPKLNPVGLLRTKGSTTYGIIGLLVARADDRYWLAAVSERCEDGETTDVGVPGRGRIFSIPQSEVVDDEIGALIALSEADDQARRLLRELIRRQPPDSVPEALRAQDYAETLEPPAVSPCPADTPEEPRAEALEPAVRVLRQAGDPRMLVLDATGSRGDIDSYHWTIPPDDRRTHAFIRYRVPDRRSGDIRIRLRVADAAGNGANAKVMVLAPISNTTLFALDEAVVTRAGEQALHAVIEKAGGPEGVQRIYVDGHTDSSGREAYNVALSERRVRAVARVLRRELGVPADSIAPRGFGESVPLVSNESSTGRRRNRRVEMIVVRRS